MKTCIDCYLNIVTSFQQKNDQKWGNNVTLIYLKFVGELMSANCLLRFAHILIEAAAREIDGRSPPPPTTHILTAFLLNALFSSLNQI